MVIVELIVISSRTTALGYRVRVRVRCSSSFVTEYLHLAAESKMSIHHPILRVCDFRQAEVERHLFACCRY